MTPEDMLKLIPANAGEAHGVTELAVNVDGGDSDDLILILTGKVNGVATTANAGCENKPVPDQIAQEVANSVAKSFVDALLMRRSYDDGKPTVFQDGEPQPHVDFEWGDKEREMLAKHGINV
jgi:hypothetical protein